MVNVGGFTEGNKPDEAVQALVEGVKGDVEKVRVLKISHAVTRLLSGVSGPTLTLNNASLTCSAWRQPSGRLSPTAFAPRW